MTSNSFSGTSTRVWSQESPRLCCWCYSGGPFAPLSAGPSFLPPSPSLLSPPFPLPFSFLHFTLARQVPYHLSHTSSPVCFRLFFRVSDFCLGCPRTVILLPLLLSWDYRPAPPHPAHPSVSYTGKHPQTVGLSNPAAGDLPGETGMCPHRNPWAKLPACL
jgi:hypothetical protein